MKRLNILTLSALLTLLLSLLIVNHTYANYSHSGVPRGMLTTTSCQNPQALDVYYILDLSSSMGQSYIGATNKLEAAKIAIGQANSLINNWNNGSRFGMITFYAGQNGVGNPPTYEVITTNQLAFRPFWGGLTSSENTFNNKLNTLTANGDNPLASALNFSEGQMEIDNEGNRAVFVVLAGATPTLSNERYLFDEAAINTIPILDGEGGFRPQQEVRVDGGPAEDYPGYFNGETPADIMQMVDDMISVHSDWTLHAMALQGDPPFNDEILRYLAEVGHGIFAAPDNLSDLEASLQQAMESSACAGDTPTPTPTGTPPTSTPTPTSCQNPQALDVYYILDLSSSMGQSYIGATNKLEAAKIAISQANSLIGNWNNGSRFGLLTFYGGQNGVGNPPTYEVITSNQLASRPSWGGLTSNQLDFNNQLNALTAHGSTPTYDALNFSEGEMLSDTDAGHIPVFILLSDGVPTLSSEHYSFNDADVQAVSLRDAEGNWRDIEDVRLDGETGGAPGYYSGEPLADVMQEMNDIISDHPEFAYHGIAVQGSGNNSFNSELLEYVAEVGHGIFAAPDNLSDLEASLQQAMESSACAGDTPTPTPTGTPPTSTPTPTSCQNPQALDVYYILDLSSSMGQLYPGATNKLQAAKIAISQANSLIGNWNNGSRFGLLTFYGGQNGVGNPPTYQAITSNQLAFRPFWGGLTSSENTFNNKLNPLSAGGSTPLAHALNFSEGEMVIDNEGNRPIFVVLSDGVPTISLGGLAFNDTLLNQIAISDGQGGWRSALDVRADGGDPLADVMEVIDAIMAAHPDWTYHALAIQSTSPYNDEIMQYIADVGHGIFAAPDNLSDLESSLQQAIESSACAGDTPTPTPTPPANASLVCAITLQGRPPAPNPRWSVPLTVSLTTPGNDSSTYEWTPISNENGILTITDITPGSYELRLKHNHTLQKMLSVELQAGSNSYDCGTLLEGDANGDNSVTIIDFSLLATAFGKCEGTTGYDERADFNLDNCITLLDFSLLASNFGQGGHLAPVRAATDTTGEVSLIIDQPVLELTEVGQTLLVTVQVEADMPVDGAAALIDFDEDMLKVKTINAGSFPLVLQNQFDNQTGTIDFTSGTLESEKNGTITLMEVEFEALGIGQSPLQFQFKHPRTTDVTAGGKSVLTHISDGTENSTPSAVHINTLTTTKGENHILWLTLLLVGLSLSIVRWRSR